MSCVVTGTDFLDAYVDCSYSRLSNETEAVLEKLISEGRNGLGIIFVFAGGNELSYGSSTGFDAFVSSRTTIGVGAVGKRGYHVCNRLIASLVYCELLGF